MDRQKKLNYIAGIILGLILLAVILRAVVFIRSSSGKGPNVIFIYLDALRADHLGCYGYERDTSPHIDRLAQSGVMFKNAITQAPATFPSVHATLTSKYASHFFDTTKCRLEEKHLTLAEVLKDNGYYTVAFSSSPIITRRKTQYSLGGFDQGFDLFDDSIYQGKKWNWQWRNPEGVIESALAWLNKNHRKKFFLFLYIMDPHCKYRCPKPYSKLFDPDYDGKNLIVIGHPTPYEARILKGLDTDLTERDIYHLVALYDGEITYADAQIGRLSERLEELNLVNNTLIIITSDHGEEFFEHGGLKHGYTVYDEVIKVPIIMKYPPLIAGGTEVDELIQSIDIVPTVLDIADIEKPEVMQGESLLPLVRKRPLFSASKESRPKWRDYAIIEAPFADAKGIVTKKWKYVHHFEIELVKPDLCDKYSKGKELYDLENDPKELNNLYSEKTEIAGELYRKMIGLLPEKERERLKLRKPIEIDEETQERLKSLGYLH